MSAFQTVRVSAVRSQNPRGFGGAIFSAKAIDERGNLLDAAGYVVVKATSVVLGGSRVEPGQWWKVAGPSSTRHTQVNGFQVVETQIDAASACLLRPSGEHIVAYMADSSAFEGVGQVKARRLWEAFGDDLYKHLDQGDVGALSAVLKPESAAQVVAAWAQHGDSRTLQWLQAEGFDLTLGRKLLQYFGDETSQKIEQDPYRLLSFSATWRQTDLFARSHFGIALDVELQ